MNVLSAEWVLKAEGDLIVAERELRARKKPFMTRAVIIVNSPPKNKSKRSSFPDKLDLPARITWSKFSSYVCGLMVPSS